MWLQKVELNFNFEQNILDSLLVHPFPPLQVEYFVLSAREVKTGGFNLIFTKRKTLLDSCLPTHRLVLAQAAESQSKEHKNDL